MPELLPAEESGAFRRDLLARLLPAHVGPHANRVRFTRKAATRMFMSG